MKKKRKKFSWINHPFSRNTFMEICSDIIDYYIADSRYGANRDELMEQFKKGALPIIDKMPERMFLGAFILNLLTKLGVLIDSHVSLKIMKLIYIPEVLEVIDLFVFHHTMSDGDLEYSAQYCYNVLNYKIRRYKKIINGFCLKYGDLQDDEQIKKQWYKFVKDVRSRKVRDMLKS